MLETLGHRGLGLPAALGQLGSIPGLRVSQGTLDGGCWDAQPRCYRAVRVCRCLGRMAAVDRGRCLYPHPCPYPHPGVPGGPWGPPTPGPRCAGGRSLLGSPAPPFAPRSSQPIGRRRESRPRPPAPGHAPRPKSRPPGPGAAREGSVRPPPWSDRPARPRPAPVSAATPGREGPAVRARLSLPGHSVTPSWLGTEPRRQPGGVRGRGRWWPVPSAVASWVPSHGQSPVRVRPGARCCLTVGRAEVWLGGTRAVPRCHCLWLGDSDPSCRQPGSRIRAGPGAVHPRVPIPTRQRGSLLGAQQAGSCRHRRPTGQRASRAPTSLAAGHADAPPPSCCARCGDTGAAAPPAVTGRASLGPPSRPPSRRRHPGVPAGDAAATAPSRSASPCAVLASRWRRPGLTEDRLLPTRRRAAPP